MYLSTLSPLLISSLPLLYAANHDISVGPALTYTPNTTIAAVGDTLTFHFYSGRHDVAQGSFNMPCQPQPNGFYSGFIFPDEQAQDGTEANRTFLVKVVNEDPIWFYCSEKMHCQLGMVGVVNPPSSDETLESYSTASKATKNSTTPPEIMGGEVIMSPSPSSSSVRPSATSTPLGTDTSETPQPSQTESPSDAIVLGGGKMMLSAFAAVVALGVFALGLV